LNIFPSTTPLTS